MNGIPITTTEQAAVIPDQSRMVGSISPLGEETRWTWHSDSGWEADDLNGSRLTHIAIPVEDAIAMREDLLEWAAAVDNPKMTGFMVRMADAILPEPLAEVVACPPDWQVLVADLVEDGSGYALAAAREALKRWPCATDPSRPAPRRSSRRFPSDDG